MSGERLRSTAMLVAFLLLTLGGGFLIGTSFPPGEWYAGLAKPGFTPPNALFPVAWSVAYVLVALAGWRVWRRGPADARLSWIAQMLLNFAWSPVFFGEHRIGAGLAVLAALLAVILVFLMQTVRANRLAFLLFLPYAAWVGFATLLNAAVWRLN